MSPDSAARGRSRLGVSFQILDASDGIGGRVRTDEVDGFLLDRGFQVLLTAYPEARRQLRLEDLDLYSFFTGALIRYHGRFFRLGDPWREKGVIFSTLFAPLCTLKDLWHLSRLRGDLRQSSIAQIFARRERTTSKHLKELGFSRRFTEAFFRPMFGGVFLDPGLTVSSRMFEFVFKMMAEGETVLPNRGIGAISAQLAEGLPGESIRLGARVERLFDGGVELADGEILHAGQVVLAVDGSEASRLLEKDYQTPGRGTICIYFSAPEEPLEEPILVLNGRRRGLINHLAVPSKVAPGYAPAGKSLISASIIGINARDDLSLVQEVRSQLKRWFGLRADEWRVLGLYRIPEALPALSTIEWQKPSRLREGLYLCGDHRATPSLQGAMESGRLAGETLLRDANARVPTTG